MVGGNNDKWPLFRGFGSWKFQRGGGGGRGVGRGGGPSEYSGLRRGGRGYDLNGGTSSASIATHHSGSSAAEQTSGWSHSHSASGCTEGLILRVPLGSAFDHTSLNDYRYRGFGNGGYQSNEEDDVLNTNRQPYQHQQHYHHRSRYVSNHDDEDSDDDDAADDDDGDNNGLADNGDDELFFDGLNNTDNTESGSLVGIYNNQQRERHYQERERRQLQQGTGCFSNVHGHGEERSENLATTSEIYTTSTAATSSLIDSNKSQDKWNGYKITTKSGK